MKQKTKMIFKIILIFTTILSILLFTMVLVYVCTKPNISIKFQKKASVCIDAGHGGKDTGATFQGRTEKDDVLNLSLAVADYLREKGVKVYLTREDDTFKTLSDRCNFANKKKVDIFISIHRNSADKGSGVEAWISSMPNGLEEILAKNILNQLEQTNKISNNRGIKKGYRKNKDGNYFVNANTNMPSCLLEVGFITNNDDNNLFDSNFQEYAFAIGEGILISLQEFS